MKGVYIMNIWMILLWCIGALTAVFGGCRILLWRWDRYESRRYVERQTADQDRAGKTAFFALMGYLATVQLLRMLTLEGIAQAMDSLLWIGLLLGIAVYGTIAIWTNAYNFTQKKWKAAFLGLLGLAVVHLADFVDLGYVYRDGTWWYVGQVLTQHGIFVNVDFWVKLVVGLVWLYLALLVFVRKKLNERE